MASVATARPRNISSKMDVDQENDFDERADDHESDSRESETNARQRQQQHSKERTKQRTSSDKIFKVDEELLHDEERKTCASMILHCFAARRNQWSTNQELGPICARLRGSTRQGVDNVHDHKRGWKNIAKKFNYGHDHKNGGEEGCEVTEPHRFCERKIIDTDEEGKEVIVRQESRIHPIFAKEIFSPGELTLSEMPPLPIRPTKKRVAVDKPAEDSLQYQFNEALKQQRRLLTKYRNKLAEIEKVRDEMCENDEKFGRYRSEYEEQEEAYRLAKKGKLVSAESAQKAKRRKLEEETFESKSVAQQDDMSDDDNIFSEDDEEERV